MHDQTNCQLHTPDLGRLLAAQEGHVLTGAVFDLHAISAAKQSTNA